MNKYCVHIYSLPCLTGKTLFRNDLAFPGSWLFPLRVYPLKLDEDNGPSSSSSSKYTESPSAASETDIKKTVLLI